MQKRLFSELGLSEPILKAVEKLGFEQTAPIQSAAIPVIMAGKDVVGQSATGSGKTAAFAIPAIERCLDTDRKVQILVLTPTRELATQVAEEFARLSLFRPKVHAVPIYGGASYDRQFSELRKGPQIVIGTPGRVIDHLQRGTLDLSEVKLAILDECDRMLDMGFREDMERILASAPKERQTVFFSATLPPPIKRLIEQFSRSPEHIKIESTAMTVPTVEQVYFDVPPRAKLDALTRLIDVHDARLSIVFANTQRTVDDLADALIARGYEADRLHGGISQMLRTRTMAKFKKSEFDILVATDVAGRGIDVDDLDLVINFDLPYDPEDYVHRIGRTGRAGRKGVALTLISGREVYRLQNVERFTKMRIRRGYVPTWDQVEEKRMSGVLDKIRNTLESGKHSVHGIYIDRLMDEGHSATDLAAAMFHHMLDAEGIETPKPGEADPFARKDAAPIRPAAAKVAPKPAPVIKKAPVVAPPAPVAEPESSNAIGERPYAEDKSSTKEAKAAKREAAMLEEEATSPSHEESDSFVTLKSLTGPAKEATVPAKSDTAPTKSATGSTKSDSGFTKSDSGPAKQEPSHTISAGSPPQSDSGSTNSESGSTKSESGSPQSESGPTNSDPVSPLSETVPAPAPAKTAKAAKKAAPVEEIAPEETLADDSAPSEPETSAPVAAKPAKKAPAAREIPEEETPADDSAPSEPETSTPVAAKPAKKAPVVREIPEEGVPMEPKAPKGRAAARFDAEVEEVELEHEDHGARGAASQFKSQPNPDKSPGGPRQLPAPATGYKWITFSLGKEDGIMPRDIVDAITESGQFEGKSVGLIKLHDNECDVQVRADVAPEIVSTLNGQDFAGKSMKVHFSRTAVSPWEKKGGKPGEGRGGFRDRASSPGGKPGGFTPKPGGFAGKPGGYGGKPGGFGGKPGGFYKKPGGYGDAPRSDAPREGGFRRDDDRPRPFSRPPGAEDRRGPGGARPFQREERRDAPPRGTSRSREDDRGPARPGGPPKRYGPPKKGPGRW